MKTKQGTIKIMDRDIKVFRVTFHLNFDIDATSEEACREIANIQAIDWLKNINSVDNDEIEIKLKTN